MIIHYLESSKPESFRRTLNVLMVQLSMLIWWICNSVLSWLCKIFYLTQKYRLPVRQFSFNFVAALVAFPTSAQSDNVVASVTFDQIKRGGLPFIAQLLIILTLIGTDYLGDYSWDDISKFGVFAAAADVFEQFLVGIDVYIVNISWNLNDLHSFQLLVLRLWIIKNISFVCTTRINLLRLNWSSDR